MNSICQKGLVEAIRSGNSGSSEEKSGLRHADYLAIGISSALLGMLYVAGLVGFICYRRRKRQLENVHIKLAAQPSTPVQELGIMRLNPLLQSTRPVIPEPSTNLRSSHRSSRESRSVIFFFYIYFIFMDRLLRKTRPIIYFYYLLFISIETNHLQLFSVSKRIRR